MKALRLTHAVITGGSSGIGLALAKKLVQQGSDVCLIARDTGRLEAAIDMLTGMRVREDQNFRCLSMDVSKEALTRNMLKQYCDVHGAPDLLVNSAGIPQVGYFEEITYERVHKTLDINILGTWNVIQAVIPYMKARGRGSIINVSSIAGYLGLFGYSAYAASKFAIIGLSESLRNEFKPDGISIHVLCPPDTDTPQLEEEEKHKPGETKAITSQKEGLFSNTKVFKPEEVAEACLKGLRKGAFMIMPGGENRFLYFIKRVFPSFANSILDGYIKKARNHE